MEDHGWIGWILPHFRPTTCPTCHRRAPRKSGSALLGGSWRIDPAGNPPGGWLGSTSPPAWPAGPGLLSNGNKPAFRNNMISAYGFLNLNRIYIYRCNTKILQLLINLARESLSNFGKQTWQWWQELGRQPIMWDDHFSQRPLGRLRAAGIGLGWGWFWSRTCHENMVMLGMVSGSFNHMNEFPLLVPSGKRLHNYRKSPCY
jgi:hypothetical protein